MPSLLTTPWRAPDPMDLVAIVQRAAAQQQQQAHQQQVLQANLARELANDMRLAKQLQVKQKFDAAAALRDQQMTDARVAELGARTDQTRTETAGIVGDQKRWDDFLGGTGGPVEPELPTGDGPAQTLVATGYHPFDVQNEAERRMEGPPVDAKGNPIHTLEQFKAGKAPHVTVAVPQGSDLFGKTLSSPDAPGIVFKADDHFGTLGGKKISGPRIDIAVNDRDAASALTGQRLRFMPTDAPAARRNPVVDVAAQLRPVLGALPSKVGQQALKEAAVASLRPRAGTQASIEEMTAGMTPVPEHQTFKDSDGMEWFIRSGKLASYKPQSVVAKRFAQGDDGRVYAFGSDGQPMEPIPDSVKVDLNPGKVQTVKDNVGNVLLVNRDGSASMLIPAKAKLTDKGRKEYMTDVERVAQAQAEVDTRRKALETKGERGLGNWFGASKESVTKAEQELKEASLKLDMWHKQHPDLGTAVTPAASKPVTRDVAAEALKEAGGDRAKAKELLKQRGYALN